MSNKKTDPLFNLIKTLSKSEKRNFRLYVNRIHDSENTKFVQLFDVLDKQVTYNEEVIFEKIPSIKRSQLSNLKRHLQKQLLTSLRLIHISKKVDIQIREQIDFAQILYGKGLYLQSLKTLDRAKTIANETHQDLLHLEIIEFEKLIESRHITRSIETRADELSTESEKQIYIVNNALKLSNLSLQLYGMYIKLGHIKNEKDLYLVTYFFNANFPNLDFQKLSFFEKIYFFQSHLWYHYITQNFLMCYRYAQKWVDLFDLEPEMKTKEVDLYIRGMHNLLVNLFYLNHYEKLCVYLKHLELFVANNSNTFNKNTEILCFSFTYVSKLNKHFMEGSFMEGLSLVNDLEKKLKQFHSFIDEHRVLVFYYKIACIYFGSGDNEKTIIYLNKVINLKIGNLHEDIQCYSRLLHLIAHYELGHYGLLKYLVKSVYRFLAKMENLDNVRSEILKFLRTALNKNPRDLKNDFIQLKNRLEKYQDHDYEKRSFLYLDIISWLECKIHQKSVQEIIQGKFKKNRK